MKMIKRTVALGFALVSMMSAVSISASAANTKDTTYIVEASRNSGGTPYSTNWRPKSDYSSVYCENTSSSGGSLTAWVERTNDTNNKSVYVVDRYYGSWSYNGATKNSKTLSKGTYYYLPNYVKEDGYSYASVGFIMNKEAVKYSIAWSPDSI